MYKLAYDFLRWLPLGIFGGSIALASSFKQVADWFAASVPRWAATLSANPLVSVLTLLALGAYLAVLLWLGHKAAENKPRLTGRIIGIITGDLPAGASNAHGLLAHVEVSNTGGMPSGAKLYDWQFLIESPRGSRQLEMVHPTEDFRMAIGDKTLVFSPENAIYNQLLEPLAVGASKSGYIYALVSPEDRAALLNGSELRVILFDVLGKRSIIRYKANTGPPHKLPYIPGSRLETNG